MHAEMDALGFAAPKPPRSEITSLAALKQLWKGAALKEIETREITVQRTFTDFEDYWTTSTLAATVCQTITAMDPGDIEVLKARIRARLIADATGRITCSARANAIRGIRSR
jgi:hypothetical protein